VGIDREAAVKKAEDLVRGGKLDLAIEEYRRLVADQPNDVGAGNALGDLFAKAGDKARAVAQFAQIGDTQKDSGFIPKAVAFYKKALKVDPACEHALVQLAEIAAGQTLYADATLYLNRLLQLRRDQNDEAGVAQCLVQLSEFPSASAETKVAAAHAAAGHSTPSRAALLWVEAADALERTGRAREAIDVLIQAVNLDAADETLQRRIAVACAETGQIERARPFLTRATAADHPALLLECARLALAEGRKDEARDALLRVIDVAPDRRAEAEALLGSFAEAAEGTTEVPAEVTIEMPAEAAVDDAVSAEGVELDFDQMEPLAVEPPVVEPPVEERPREESPPEEWWSHEVAAPVREEPIAEVPAPVAEEPIREPQVVGSAQPQEPVHAESRSVQLGTAPDPDPEAETIAALRAAAQNPALEFQASAQLGRLFMRLGRIGEAIEWLARASQSATSAREQRLEVMYALADALERSGDSARAFDVFADLDFDAASYRDVQERMARLRRALEEGRAT
jgi:tetratricopeptide (TPR) repeat protein